MSQTRTTATHTNTTTTETAGRNNTTPDGSRVHRKVHTRQALSSPPAIQPKLTIGAVDDPMEREADAVADQVMRMPDPVAAGGQIQRQGPEDEELQAKPLIQRMPPEEEELQTKPLIQRKCAECMQEDEMARRMPLLQRQGLEEEELQAKPLIQRMPPEEEELRAKPLIQRMPPEEEELQAKPLIQREAGSLAPTPAVTPEISSQVHGLRGRGETMSPVDQSFFAPRMPDVDVSKVRVHTDSSAQQLARSVDARAFTFENNVVMGKGEYSPGTDSGRRLMAHELTHVAQQGKAPGVARKGKVQRQPVGGVIQREDEEEIGISEENISPIGDFETQRLSASILMNSAMMIAQSNLEATANRYAEAFENVKATLEGPGEPSIAGVIGNNLVDLLFAFIGGAFGGPAGAFGGALLPRMVRFALLRTFGKNIKISDGVTDMFKLSVFKARNKLSKPPADPILEVLDFSSPTRFKEQLVERIKKEKLYYNKVLIAMGELRTLDLLPRDYSPIIEIQDAMKTQKRAWQQKFIQSSKEFKDQWRDRMELALWANYIEKNAVTSRSPAFKSLQTEQSIRGELSSRIDIDVPHETAVKERLKVLLDRLPQVKVRDVSHFGVLAFQGAFKLNQ